MNCVKVYDVDSQNYIEEQINKYQMDGKFHYINISPHMGYHVEIR